MSVILPNKKREIKSKTPETEQIQCLESQTSKKGSVNKWQKNKNGRIPVRPTHRRSQRCRMNSQRANKVTNGIKRKWTESTKLTMKLKMN